MLRARILLFIAIFFLSAGAAWAQKNEVSLLIGGTKTGDRSTDSIFGSVKIDTGFTVQAAYSTRLINAHLASLYLDFPVTVTPNSDLESSSPISPKSYSAWFFTPGIKVKVLPNRGITPYGVLGVGFGHFSSSDETVTGAPNPGSKGNTTGVFDFGAGVDIGLLPLVALRGEVRDFVSGNPNFNAAVSGGKQHNVFFGAGIVLRF